MIEPLLFSGFKSSESLLVFAEIAKPSSELFGIVYVTLHMMLSPEASVGTVDDGKQTTTASGGSAVTTHEAFAAVLGPSFLQMTVPLTFPPFGTDVGKPEKFTFISETGVITNALLSVLFDAFGSGVVLLAAAPIVREPFFGTKNVLVQVIAAAPFASVGGIGVGAQLCVASAGRLVSAQVGAAASLGPLFTQLALTVMLSPPCIEAGSVTVACMSAAAVMSRLRLALLLPATGSVTLLPVVAFRTTGPLPGAMNLTVQTMFA